MSRFPIPRPRSGDGTILPAALAGLLVVTLALQVAFVPSDEPELDAARWAGASAPLGMPPITPAVASRAILEQPIFTPARATGGGTAADPLAGAQVAGAWSVGRQANLVVREADGGTRTVRIGQSVNQWILTAITPQGARFSRDGQSMLVPFGATAPQNAPTQQEDENQ
jgi:hypothetical protein